ncbi:MAG TPA: activator-dependent family glycosyltransferase [Streptosporangiaceae bacterium]|jgi:glycosyltransferase (activator-dependent family)
MRVLLASYADKSHFYPMVPIAWALRAAGHEVRVATQRPLVETVLQSGLPAVPIAEGHNWQEQVVAASLADGDWEAWVQRVTDLSNHGHQMGWDDLHRNFDEVVERTWKHFNNGMISGLVEYAREWAPGLILWEPFTFGGAIAGRVTGIPHVRVTWGADVWVRARQRFTALAARAPQPRPDPLRDWLGAEMARYGGTFDEELFTGQWTLDQSPASLRLPLGLPTLTARWVPYNGPAEIPGWLREPVSRPRICLTGGLTARGLYGTDLLQVPALRALAELNADVVATIMVDPGERDSVPENVRLADFVPLDMLLPTCSAVVHLGGFGVMSTAIRHGVPQLTLPKLGDSTVRAELLRDAGAGLVIPHGEATPEAVRDSVRRLLAEPAFAGAAARLRAEMLAQPAPSEVVVALERLAQGKAG